MSGVDIEFVKKILEGKRKEIERKLAYHEERIKSLERDLQKIMIELKNLESGGR